MDQNLTVIGHLEEFRKRLIIALIAVGVTTVVSIPFSAHLLKILKFPASGIIDKLAFFGPEEAFLIYMRVSLLSGILFAFPVIAYQIWRFISPAIDAHIRRSFIPFIFCVCAAFAGGCAFAYWCVLPNALRFLMGLGGDDLLPVISAERYVSFVVGLIVACGIMCEMPVMSYFCARLGIITARFLRAKFKYALIGIFIAAAVITPTGDAFNMTMLALPMLVLYEISIWVAAWAGKQRGLYGR